MLGFAFGLPFCVPNFKVIGARVCILYQFVQVCENTRKKKNKIKKKNNQEKKRNFGRSYLGNGLSDFLQIWNVDSPSWRATLQQIWFQSDKLSPRYKSVKTTFSFFLKYTHGVARRLLGPHDTLPCVLIVEFCLTKGIGDLFSRTFRYISPIETWTSIESDHSEATFGLSLRPGFD